MILQKQFDDNFKQQLYQIIEDLENNSRAEIVVIIRQQSDKYRDVSLAVAGLGMIFIFTVLMFIPVEINPYAIYFFTVVTFPLLYFGIEIIEQIKRRLISRKRIEKTVEIYARAIFQKGKMHLTEDHTGMLIFVSLFEQKVFIVGDKAINTKIPEHLLAEIREEFDKIFDYHDVSTSLLERLKNLKPVLNKYIPPVENDINEISDNLEVNL